MTELKPCPFCGGEASLIQTVEPIVVCNAGYMCDAVSGDAVEGWNTRNYDDIIAKVEALYIDMRGKVYISDLHNKALGKVLAILKTP